MQVDTFLANYNANTTLLEEVSKSGRYASAKNYAEAEFGDLLKQTNSQKASAVNAEFASNSSNFNKALLAVRSNLNPKEPEKIDESTLSAEEKEELEYEKALKEQTDAFEAFLVKTVLDVSLKNKASLFEKDASDDIYSSMYNDTMSKALSGGIGFSQLLFDFLRQKS